MILINNIALKFNPYKSNAKNYALLRFTVKGCRFRVEETDTRCLLCIDAKYRRSFRFRDKFGVHPVLAIRKATNLEP
ncbi:MAG: hypothetical protein JRD05_07495 [Deltaproteobacteria bacterium]|nr:hypothetical protein [Deltaproteobacteria bacterium]